MAVRALMVDVDGVVIRQPDGRHWQDGLEVSLGVDPDLLQREFFQPHFAEIVVGRDALRPRLADVLARIAPDLSADDLISYWFARDAVLDRALLDDLRAVRRGGVALHLATTQESLRAEHLWHALALHREFDAIHASSAIGHAKPDPAFFRAVERRTGFGPDDLLLIDDAPVNVAGARRAGWAAHLWTPRSRVADLPLDRPSPAPARISPRAAPTAHRSARACARATPRCR